MLKKRIQYSVITLFIIIAGILSRTFECIPLFIGDILYAIMIYFIVCTLIPQTKSLSIFLIAIIICFTIEFQQILDMQWLVNIRKSKLGHYILGQGFLISDLIYYSIGVSISYILHTKLTKKIASTSF